VTREKNKLIIKQQTVQPETRDTKRRHRWFKIIEPLFVLSSKLFREFDWKTDTSFRRWIVYENVIRIDWIESFIYLSIYYSKYFPAIH
jgi:hypothetical protein